VGVHPLDLDLQLGVAQRAGAGLSVLGGVVGGMGDLEYVADRLDPEGRLVRLHVGHYYRHPRRITA
jgi:hypothetical protein